VAELEKNSWAGQEMRKHKKIALNHMTSLYISSIVLRISQYSNFVFPLVTRSTNTYMYNHYQTSLMSSPFLQDKINSSLNCLSHGSVQIKINSVSNLPCIKLPTKIWGKKKEIPRQEN
jgi:hypothetical protein